MYKTVENTRQNLPDVTKFIETVESSREFFDKSADIFVSRAPGRLDVMGGIADYSGSLVLEMPIAEAVLVALQKSGDANLKIVSVHDGQKLNFEMPLADFENAGEIIEYSDARAYFRKNPDDHWAAYIAGVFLVLMREKHFDFAVGARIFIASNVPPGKGVSSSAALEAAVMTAAAAAFNIKIEPRELALLCQKVENLVVGAPCGIMDQMSVVCGGENELLSMICQPAELQKAVVIPEEIAFWGIDSGIRHSVVGADYGSVRTGAFIGYRIIADVCGLPFEETEIAGAVKIKDEKYGGYLANISPAEFEEKFAAHLPEKISGAEFLEKYKGITDTATKVSPAENYAVLHPTAHPVYENARVFEFARLLQNSPNEENLKKLGELMFKSHESYSTCGLGSNGTDLLVELVKKIGLKNGLYGAKITGGGSGGTIAVLGLKNAAGTIQKIAAEYRKQTDLKPSVFIGSSPGANDFGIFKLVR